MGQCIRCGQGIANGRTYCTAHYQNELALHQRRVAQYHHNVKIWSTLSDQEKAAYNNQAVEDDRTLNVRLLGFGLAVVSIFIQIFILAGPLSDLSGNIKFLLFIATPASIYSIFHFKGDIVKPYAGSILIFIIGSIISFFVWGCVGLVSYLMFKADIIFDNYLIINIASILALLTYLIKAYKTGRHKATAEPQMPIPPSP